MLWGKAQLFLTNPRNKGVLNVVVCECGIYWLYSKGTHCLDFIAKYRGHKLTQTLPVVHVLS